jgi:hypothetical protein
VKIKSKINVITNSSSEVFIFKSNLKKNKILSDLHELTKDCVGCSEMGGILEFKKPVWLPDDYLSIEIDHGYDLEKIKKYISSIGCLSSENFRDKFYSKKIKKLWSEIGNANSEKEVIKLFDKIENLLKERDNEN